MIDYIYWAKRAQLLLFNCCLMNLIKIRTCLIEFKFIFYPNFTLKQNILTEKLHFLDFLNKQEISFTVISFKNTKQLNNN